MEGFTLALSPPTILCTHTPDYPRTQPKTPYLLPHRSAARRPPVLKRRSRMTRQCRPTAPSALCLGRATSAGTCHKQPQGQRGGPRQLKPTTPNQQGQAHWSWHMQYEPRVTMHLLAQGTLTLCHQMACQRSECGCSCGSLHSVLVLLTLNLTMRRTNHTLQLCGDADSLCMSAC
jgi:hypothetical protein